MCLICACVCCQKLPACGLACEYTYERKHSGNVAAGHAVLKATAELILFKCGQSWMKNTCFQYNGLQRELHTARGMHADLVQPDKRKGSLNKSWCRPFGAAWMPTHLVFVERSASGYCQDSIAVKASICNLIGLNRFPLSEIRPREIEREVNKISTQRVCV